MPPTSRRRKPSRQAQLQLQQQRKLRQIEGDDGWTHVLKGPSASALKTTVTTLPQPRTKTEAGNVNPEDPEATAASAPDKPPKETSSSPPSPSISRGPASIPSSASIEALRAKRARFADGWANSRAAGECRTLLERTLRESGSGGSSESRKITSAVCLGLGSLCGERVDGNAWRRQDAALAQMVAFEGWIEDLRMFSNMIFVLSRGVFASALLFLWQLLYIGISTFRTTALLTDPL